jgi:hypothetical protein
VILNAAKNRSMQANKAFLATDWQPLCEEMQRGADNFQPPLAQTLIYGAIKTTR